MILSALYLLVNAVTVVLLLRARYHAVWRLLCAQLSVTCWQITIILCLPLSDRTMAIRYWLPGDLLLMCLSGGAICETLWAALRGIPRAYKWGVLVSLLGGLVFTGLA